MSNSAVQARSFQSGMSSQQDRQVPDRERRQPWAVVINDAGFIQSCVRALHVQLPADAAGASLQELCGDEIGGVVAVLLTSPDRDAAVANIESADHPSSALIRRIDPRPIREAIQQAMFFPRSDLPDSDLKRQCPAVLSYHSHLFDASGCPGGFLAIESIICVRAAGQGTHVHATGGRWIKSASSLRNWEARLPSTHFTRIHRSTIVNMERVERTERQLQGSGQRVFLRGMRDPLALSRRYAARLRRRRV
jgi:DNA-binding LytR/AlgR family response regulator